MTSKVTGHAAFLRGNQIGRAATFISTDTRLTQALATGTISEAAATDLISRIARRQSAKALAARIRDQAELALDSARRINGTRVDQAIVLAGDFLLRGVLDGSHEIATQRRFKTQRHDWYHREVHLGDAWAELTADSRVEAAHPPQLRMRHELNGDLRLGYEREAMQWHDSPKIRLYARQPRWLRQLMDRSGERREPSYTLTRKCYAVLENFCAGIRPAFYSNRRDADTRRVIRSYFALYQSVFGSLRSFEEIPATRHKLASACQDIYLGSYFEQGDKTRFLRLRLDEDDVFYLEEFDPHPYDDRKPEIGVSSRIELHELGDPDVLSEIALRSIVSRPDPFGRCDGKNMTIAGDPFRAWELIFRACH
ncbi:MAG: hypothetical protein KDD69_05330 [Bdellovibrionales bacterium]|nr:hypothetical protein [Bdellovibrionales bacterium]